ncbi:molecular chaperone TorD family protein [uncultured Ferrimonas sp.]|uniref:TorD/DmsD family molecular chaperone n=1 Tax=uncultured Ferrimonas sp. TaxID=432640 RepID=UPI00261F2CBC|nr:molecular chaperone TorD family protein [uncultured Ferrimonas sp.]
MLTQAQIQDFQAQCNVLYHALYFEPSDCLLDQFRATGIEHSWPQTGRAEPRQAGLNKLTSALQLDNDSLLSEIKRDHMALFVGPSEIKAIPWGSPYLHEKRLLCGPSTIALAEFYQHHGILVETQTNEPVDHIGLVLSAISALLADEAKQQNGHALAALNVLLAEHLLPWSGRFLAIMQAQAQSDYYQGIALLTDSVLGDLQQQLQVEALQLQLFQ